MKIGVYMPRVPRNEGGGLIFQSSILNVIHKYNGRHNFYIFCRIGAFPESSLPTECVKHIFLEKDDSSMPLSEDRKSKRYYTALLNAAITEYEIDIMLFINPFSFLPVRIPYIYIVWDLQHRLQPYFPEVSAIGLDWDERENLYKQAIPKASYIITGNSIGKKEIVEILQYI